MGDQFLLVLSAEHPGERLVPGNSVPLWRRQRGRSFSAAVVAETLFLGRGKGGLSAVL